MKDWRRCGEELFAELRGRWDAFTQDLSDKAKHELTFDLPGIYGRMARVGPPQPYFKEALDKLRDENDPSALADYLRSELPLGTRERDLLAGLFEHHRREAHRPVKTNLRFAASPFFPREFESALQFHIRQHAESPPPLVGTGHFDKDEWELLAMPA